MPFHPFAALPLVLCAAFAAPGLSAQEAIVVDHHCTDHAKIPPAWVTRAKEALRIVYGHTSHGSQVTSGMTGLVGFAKGGAQYAWSRTGTGGALVLHDQGMAGDCGYYPQWVDNTKRYLDDPQNAKTNVVLWSWCGQVSDYTSQMLLDRYLRPMEQLEASYPHVRFVYMTGHLEILKRANTNARNDEIRSWCRQKGKVLYDFADIESYDQDGKHFPYADDTCDYFDAQSTKLGNWAIEWQNSHVQGVDWYSCSSAHSQPLNANLKAYAVWWLWARLAGWEGDAPLATNGERVSARSGGRAGLLLDGGAARAGLPYLVLASGSGRTPGTPIPGTPVTVPLVFDEVSRFCLQEATGALFPGFVGVFDPNGTARAAVALPPLHAGFAGFRLDFAWLPLTPIDDVSNAVTLVLAP